MDPLCFSCGRSLRLASWGAGESRVVGSERIAVVDIGIVSYSHGSDVQTTPAARRIMMSNVFPYDVA